MAGQANQDAVNTKASDDASDTSNEDVLDTGASLGDDWDDDSSDSEDKADDETEETEESEDDEQASDSDDDDEEVSDDDVEEEVADEDADASDDDEDAEEVAEKPLTKEEKQARNAEAAERRIADKEQKRIATREKQQKAYIDEAANAADAALRTLQVDTYNNRVMQVTTVLQGNLNAAIAAPAMSELFNHPNKDVRETMYEAIDDFERMYVIKDKNQDIIEVRGDINTYLQKRAAQLRRLTALGAKKQVEDKGKQKRRTMKSPSRAPKKAKDEFADAFDEEVASWKH